MTHDFTYPEHDKLKVIQPLSQACGEFLEWLINEKGIRLCVYDDDVLYEHCQPINKYLAEHFNIDNNKLEKEKRMMLDHIRNDTNNYRLESSYHYNV
jgi:hypothetical protein